MSDQISSEWRHFTNIGLGNVGRATAQRRRKGDVQNFGPHFVGIATVLLGVDIVTLLESISLVTLLQ